MNGSIAPARGTRPRAMLQAVPAALLGTVLSLALLLGGCASQEQASLSALHYFQRGNAAYEAEDYPRAIEHYRMALEFDAQAPDIHYNLGLAYYRMHAWEPAADAFQRATQLDPRFADAYLNLALAYDKLYNAPAAHQAYNRYRALAVGDDAPPGAAATAAASASGRPGTATAAGGTAAGVDFRPSAARPPGQPAGSVNGSADGAQRVEDLLKALGVSPPPAEGAAGATQAGPPGMRARTAGSARATIPGGAQGAAQGYGQGTTQANTAPAGQAEPPNPYEGNAKWWTQDAASRNR